MVQAQNADKGSLNQSKQALNSTSSISEGESGGESRYYSAPRYEHLLQRRDQGGKKKSRGKARTTLPEDLNNDVEKLKTAQNH